jgi:hypothetical protein
MAKAFGRRKVREMKTDPATPPTWTVAIAQWRTADPHHTPLFSNPCLNSYEDGLNKPRRRHAIGFIGPSSVVGTGTICHCKRYDM